MLVSSLIYCTPEYRTLQVDVSVSGGCQNLLVEEAHPQNPPYIVRNHTKDVSVSVSQTNVQEGTVDISPHGSCVWSWPKPVLEQRVMMSFSTPLSEQLIEQEYSLEEIKEHKPFNVGSKQVVVIVSVRGRTKVCHVYSKMNQPGSVARSRRTSVDTISRDAAELLEGREVTVAISFPQVGFALVGNRPDFRLGLLTDIFYISLKNVVIELGQQMSGEQVLQVQIFDFQIDNGNRTTPHPVIFARQADEDPRPQLSLTVKKLGSDVGKNAFRMIQIQQREASVVLDEELVSAAMIFASDMKSTGNKDPDNIDTSQVDYHQTVRGSATELKYSAEEFYCEFLDIGPIKFSVTYASTAGISLAGNNPGAQVVLDVLANVDAAPLKLNALMLQDLGE